MTTSIDIARSSHSVDLSVVLTPNDGSTIPLDVESLTIRGDRSSPVRRRLSMTLSGTDMMPSTIGGQLAPNGASVDVRRTYVAPDGTEVVDRLGVYFIRRPSGDFRGGRVVLSGVDRGGRIQRAGFRRPLAIAAGTPVEDAIGAVLAAQAPDAVYYQAATGVTLPALLLGQDAGEDPWAVCRRLALSAAYELVVDRYDRVVLQPIPDPATIAPIATFDGTSQPLLEGSRELSAADTYSGVIVRGEGPGVIGEAWDDDPSSATYAGGNPGDPGFGDSAFGAIPYIYVDPLITSAGRAATVAAAILREVTGAVEHVTIATVPAGFELGQAVNVVNSNTKASGVYLIETMDEPGRPSDGPMSLGLRRRRQAAA